MERKNTRDWTSFLLPLALILGLVLLLSLESEPSRAEAATHSPLEPWLQMIVGYLASGAEIAAALVIGIGIVRGMAAYFVGLLPSTHHTTTDRVESIRLGLGRSLTLGLEFTVASDILRTAVAPSRQDILTLAAIVLLRTLLNLFLEQEIAEVETRRREARQQVVES